MKKLIRIIIVTFDFIGYSNFFLATAVFTATLQGGFVFKEVNQSSINFSFINFTAAFVLYNLQRIYQSTFPTIDSRLLWYRDNKKYILTLAVLFLLLFQGVLFNCVRNFPEGFYVFIGLGILTLTYFLPPFSLRKMAGLKQFLIGFVWVSVCFLIPFLYQKEMFTGLRNMNAAQINYLISQFCFISALCIPFDIRDFIKDTKEETKSLPVVFGIKKSKQIAYILLLTYFLLAFLTGEQSLLFIRAILFILGSVLIYFSQPTQHRYYFIYLIDGLIILQSILLFLFL